MSLKRQQKGFTIVELLIVIVVIGILAALVITTFTSIQQKGRNTERTTDIKALHGQIEAYYAQVGQYPTLTNLNDNDTSSATSFASVNLKGLDREAFKAPKSTSYTLVGTSTTTAYSYAPVNATGAACDNTAGNDCVKYTLSAALEGGGSYDKKSLN